MENNQSYFGELGHGVKTLLTGMKITWKEYFKDFFTNKSTEQYPENRKTTLHVAKRHRGRLVFKRNEDGTYKCTACTLCEKTCPNGTIKITSARRKRCSMTIATTLVTACSASCVPMLVTSMLSSLSTISRMPYSTVRVWYSTLTRRYIRVVLCPTSWKVVPA